jgi:predicted transcriptional regulator
MKKSFLLLIAYSVLINLNVLAQNPVGKSFNGIKLSDPNNDPKDMPYIGEKVIMILYTDPDVKDVNDPLSNAIKAKNFPKDKYSAIGVANCKDTWIPNAGIRMKARQKEKQYPGTVILLDVERLLPKALGLSDCDEMGVAVIVGKDKVIKYVKYIKTQEESKAVINEVIKLISDEIAK